MTPRYRLSDRAVADLGDIWDFIAPDDPLAADTFVAELLDVVDKLAGAPRIGRQRDDLLTGLRSHPHGNYLILYLIKSEVIEITCFIHGGRDLQAIFHPDN